MLDAFYVNDEAELKFFSDLKFSKQVTNVITIDRDNLVLSDDMKNN